MAISPTARGLPGAGEGVPGVAGLEPADAVGAPAAQQLGMLTTALMAAAVVVPGSVTVLADRVSGPVAAAAAVVVGVLLLLILVVWLARKVVHKIIGIAVSVAAAAGTHTGTQTWIHHLISTATHT